MGNFEKIEITRCAPQKLVQILLKVVYKLSDDYFFL